MLKKTASGYLLINILITFFLLAISSASFGKEDAANNETANLSKQETKSPEIKEGEYRGAKTAKHPDWFKESFLDLEEDIADATAENKRLVLYFWQPGCPYCNQLWEDNFSQKAIEEQFRKNFEIVAINMWGDREVITIAGNTFTEKSLSEALDIKYTPTLLFFDENKKVIHRLNGYIPPEAFKLSLDFVSGKHEKTQSFGEYSIAQKEQSKKSADSSSAQLHSEDFFLTNKTNLSRTENPSDKYLAVFFEEKNCKNCDLLHEKTLKDPATRKLITQFESVQFNRNAETPVITPSGKQTTIKQWANQLGISYLPAIIFFDQKGKEVMRIDVQMRTFHTQSVFDYVLTGAYKTEKNFQRYISDRANKIRAKGIDVDIWAY